ncbi:elongation factor G [Pseudonocardia sp. TRM90224]|uniref:elongation factor G n=1 Tax=Pseudonocardia sp. TRM90224 TaxID=2812678 RepID=UPI001E408328|nr:TetM/TetW/TetO/TetS family tetracycline resistance ribosomal protection protein [Pseudonocardia sp. TRM90224]
MTTLNLGILAHVDAGKTSLTERLLHTAGVIDEIGSVDGGSTQTDSLALERRRGITIKSAVVSFEVGGATVNLIDTPGHPDFIAEVERVLNVLDGAVLVVSAVEGVQAQTRVLMRTLQRLRIPTLIFVNKVDRSLADPAAVFGSIKGRLTPSVVAMGSVTGAGTRDAVAEPAHDLVDALTDVLAQHDDEVLAAYVDGRPLGPFELRKRLVAQVRETRVHPVFFGSAITGTGVDALVDGITELLPRADADPDGPVSGVVFKVERGPAGDKIAYVRMASGTVQVRDRVPLHQPAVAEPAAGKVTAISLFDRGAAVPASTLPAGRIGKLWGLTGVRIGDTIGSPAPDAPAHHFAPPTLETVVLPVRNGALGALHAALSQLTEQDPLIDLRQDDVRGEVSVSLYGEVQKEVVQETLATEYGIDVTFRETTTICVERPAGPGAAVEIISKAPNPFLASVGLRVEPGPLDSGVEFRLGVELGSMPMAFFTAVRETVAETLQQGLHGWRVTDCVVTMTHSGYYARQSHSHGTFDKSMSSTAGDFRNLTPLVLMAALAEAGTVVHEPMNRFTLELPADLLGPVTPVLARMRAVPRETTWRGSACVVEGEVPAAMVHVLQLQLPSLTRGEGVLESAFERYVPVTGPVPDRPRTDHNPLDREEYLLQVVRRTATGGRP